MIISLEKTWMLKLATIGTMLVALGLALSNTQSVFNMVIMAWSGLASAFAPLLIVLSLGHRPTQGLSMFAVIVGFSMALLWRMLVWHQYVYEGLPGIAIGLVIFMIAHRFRQTDGTLADVK